MTRNVPDPRTPSGLARRAAPGLSVACDGSAQAEAAVRWAATEAARRSCPLRILHVVDVSDLAMQALAGPPADDWPRPLIEAGQAIADRALGIATATAPTVAVQPLVCTGSPVQRIIEESCSADTLVLGSRGRGELSAACLGSVSTAVAARASCPVVIVREATAMVPGPAYPVVVGVDGSDSAARAVEVAADIAADAHALLRVVSVWDEHGEHVVLHVGHHGPRSAAEQLAEEAADAARRAHPELSVARLVVRGHPASALGPAANDAGLLVVGSRGRGAFRGLALGSVSHAVATSAHCAVMVVRVPAASRRRQRDQASTHELV